MRMPNLTRAACVAAAAVFAAAPPVAAAPAKPKPEEVVIAGYGDDAMEPFLSRDGRFLFFNTRNAPGSNTNIHFAEAEGSGFAYRGILYGTISYDLDAVPTMAADGRFCFVSPRDYRRTLVSVLCGAFDGKKVNRTAPEAGLATGAMGRLIFDVELSADGRTMVYAEGGFSGGEVPDDADLHLAELTPRGFVRVLGGEKLFASLNTSALEYAPALSPDGLTLYFTRLSGMWPFQSPSIYRATRSGPDQPFGKPERVRAADGFVEGPTTAPDGTLYYHKRVGGGFRIYRLPR